MGRKLEHYLHINYSENKLYDGDGENQTYGCRRRDPNLCDKYTHEDSVCAYYNEKHICRHPSPKWPNQYKKIKAYLQENSDLATEQKTQTAKIQIEPIRKKEDKQKEILRVFKEMRRKVKVSEGEDIKIACDKYYLKYTQKLLKALGVKSTFIPNDLTDVDKIKAFLMGLIEVIDAETGLTVEQKAAAMALGFYDGGGLDLELQQRRKAIYFQCVDVRTVLQKTKGGLISTRSESIIQRCLTWEDAVFGKMTKRLLGEVEKNKSTYDPVTMYAQKCSCYQETENGMQLFLPRIEPKEMPESLPELPDNFEPRPEFSDKIASLLQEKSILVLYGIWGSGKSTLALEYARNNADYFDEVVYINLKDEHDPVFDWFIWFQFDCEFEKKSWLGILDHYEPCDSYLLRLLATRIKYNTCCFKRIIVTADYFHPDDIAEIKNPEIYDTRNLDIESSLNDNLFLFLRDSKESSLKPDEVSFDIPGDMMSFLKVTLFEENFNAGLSWKEGSKSIKKAMDRRFEKIRKNMNKVRLERNYGFLPIATEILLGWYALFDRNKKNPKTLPISFCDYLPYSISCLLKQKRDQGWSPFQGYISRYALWQYDGEKIYIPDWIPEKLYNNVMEQMARILSVSYRQSYKLNRELGGLGYSGTNNVKTDGIEIGEHLVRKIKNLYQCRVEDKWEELEETGMQLMCFYAYLVQSFLYFEGHYELDEQTNQYAIGTIRLTFKHMAIMKQFHDFGANQAEIYVNARIFFFLSQWLIERFDLDGFHTRLDDEGLSIKYETSYKTFCDIFGKDNMKEIYSAVSLGLVKWYKHITQSQYIMHNFQLKSELSANNCLEMIKSMAKVIERGSDKARTALLSVVNDRKKCSAVERSGLMIDTGVFSIMTEKYKL